MTVVSSILEQLPPQVLVPFAGIRDRALRDRLEIILDTTRMHVQTIRDALSEWDELASRNEQTHPRGQRCLATIDRETRVILEYMRASNTGRFSLPTQWTDDLVRSERREWMDRWMPRWLRAWEMIELDRFNRTLGSYERWATRLARCVGELEAPRLHDLASGGGGFFRYIAQESRYARWDLTASDYDKEYVAQGRSFAEKQGVAQRVKFETRDALSLDALQGQVDMFVCTQAAHHMSPGVVVCMLHQAVRNAPRGVLLIDLMRSATLVAGTILAGTVNAPWFPLLALDGMQSIRRSRWPSEMELFARLAGADNVSAEFVAPAFVVMHAFGLRSEKSCL